ncbi:DUF5063 domain-containing protein [Chryseobacterium elymi]|uniref:DUF5063 domain-containing protein n=1 Tax=Chryseobacterium elymi TaxID=395936 RepID=A0A3D9DP50_9FLAO|nr:DUF5063 domain-containing protein [Chryseobacterium elymi]REC79749.1 DUF5063 domain-containing protein [Chryseobacterium elymi]
MTELIPTINEIIKYGLQPNLRVNDKEKLLEQQLVKIYKLYFDIEYRFDDASYPDFDKSQLPDIRQNVAINFKDFGFYKTILDINDINNQQDNGIGDAIEDLSDIITDLLQIKWRIENNSWADGLWYFQLIFHGHTQQHILDLLNYMKQKNKKTI